MIYRSAIETPVGRIVLSERDQALIKVSWSDAEAADITPLLDEAARQLESYFAGNLQRFDLPIDYTDCSAFQKQACEAMCAIPYGETLTYGALAEIMGSAAQPVGNACGGNPLPIIVPCHRVLGSKDIGGFSGEGGVETKIALLRMENAIPWLI